MNFAIQFLDGSRVLDGSRAVIFPNGVMSRNIPRERSNLPRTCAGRPARHGWKYSMRTDSRFIGG
jgi:hypothetical protein